MNTSQRIVKALENEGVEIIFGIPGEENVTFLDALSKSTIRYVTAADERGASFMAASYGRLTGRPGVVSTTLGPGALNIPNGLAFATMAGIPLIALTWQNGYRTGGSKDHGFMCVNVKDVLKPLVKYQQTIFSPNQVSTIIREGFNLAQTPNFGAVHIEVPEDVSEETVTEDIPFQKPPKRVTTTADLAGIALAREVLLRAKNPLIIVGFNASSIENAQAIRDLAERMGVHVITTPMAQGILPSNHPLSLFSFSFLHDSLVFDGLRNADVVITIGYNLLEFSPRFWNSNGDKIIIHINSVPAKIHQNYNPHIELIGNINNTLSMLSGKLTMRKKWQSSIFKKLRKELSKNEVDSISFPVKPQYLVQAIRNISNSPLIIHDIGMHKLWVTKFFHPDIPNQVLVDNALGSMGSGIPQGIAAKLLNPRRKVLVNTGDGGILMCLGELATVASLRIPLVILVWHDGNYGMINWHQQKRNLSSFGVAVTSPDFVKLAESFGGIGYRITHAQELETILHKAFSNNVFTIIDCPVDYSENVKVFNRREYESTTN